MTRRRHRPSTHRPPTAPPSHRRRRAPARLARLARTERPGRKPPPRRPARRVDIAARPFVRWKALRGGLPAPGRNAGARLIQIPVRSHSHRLAVGTLRRRALAPARGDGPACARTTAMLLPRAAGTPPARALAARAIRMTNWHQKRPFNDISNRYVAKYTARASTLVPKRGCLSSLVTVPLWPGFFLSAPARRRPSRARAAAAVRRHS